MTSRALAGSIPSDVEKSPLQGDHHGVSTVAGIEFWQDALHVCLDRALGNVELGGDHFVRLPRGNPYIEQHLAEPISLAVLAQLVRLSPNYFCRAFSQSFGIPPQRYHTRQRIERAKSLLAKPDATVTDVGLTVGYSEASAFSTGFRRVTGLTPTAYRHGLGE
jgi:AraC-like DNA-binding protein